MILLNIWIMWFGIGILLFGNTLLLIGLNKSEFNTIGYDKFVAKKYKLIINMTLIEFCISVFGAFLLIA